MRRKRVVHMAIAHTLARIFAQRGAEEAPAMQGTNTDLEKDLRILTCLYAVRQHDKRISYERRRFIVDVCQMPRLRSRQAGYA